MSVWVRYYNLKCELTIPNDEITQYVYYTDGVTYLRKGVRDATFVVDKTLTPTGFNGIEGSDWQNIKMVS